LSVYRRLFRNTIDNDDSQTMRDHVNQGKILGSEAFKNRIEAILDRRVCLAPLRRPSKKVL
jgi:hypothetical protein